MSKKCPFQDPKTHCCPTEYRRPHFTASKMISLYYLALQFEAFVVLLQETYCTNAEKLVLPSFQLAGSSLSRKHGLATFVHEQLRYTLLNLFTPISEIEWLCVDVDSYRIVNVHKPGLRTRNRTTRSFLPNSNSVACGDL